MFWSWEAEAEEEQAIVLAAAVEVGLICTLRAKRCRRVRSPSLLVPAALAAILAPPAIGPAMMVAPAPLMAWWQMAGRVAPTNQVYLAGQAVPRMRVVLRLTLGVEAAVALDIKGRQELMKKVVMAVRALNRPYLVPLIIMAAAVVAALRHPWQGGIGWRWVRRI